MRLLNRLLMIAGLVLCVGMLPMQAAMAHAQLLSSTPAENAVLVTAPEQVDLVFNEPVKPMSIRLIRPGGSPLDLTPETSEGSTTIVLLPKNMTMGTHVLSWRVVSADGHPIGGSVVFSIGTSTGAAEVETSGDPLVTAGLWAGKALLFVAMFLGIGGAAFGALAPLPSLSRLVSRVLSAAGVVLAPLTLGFQGLDTLGLPIAMFFKGEVWSAGFSTSYGTTALAAAVAFAMSMAALRMPPGRVVGSIGIAASCAAALALASSGHASAAAPQWLTRPAVFVHVGGVLFWVGALLPLWLLLREQTDASTRALTSFSRGIPYAVLPMVIAGLALAVIQMGAPGPHWATAYGLILATKLALLVVLFSLAVWNRGWLTVSALSGSAEARGLLRRSIGWEMATVLLILMLVAAWRFTPPPRALAEVPSSSAAIPLMVHLSDGHTMAMATVTPGAVGPVTIEISILDMDHAPKDAQSVSVTLANSDVGIEPIKRDAQNVDGAWRVEGLTVPVAGTWQLQVEARLSRFELARPSGEVIIP